MRLEGSCHCGNVSFALTSPHPYPYNLCYCSICRKTAGGGGYAINLGGLADSLEVRGEASVGVYQVTMNGKPSPVQRHFCKCCASMLWVFDPGWPELVHPFASAIDTTLPIPPERTHLMLDSKAAWVEIRQGPKDQYYAQYPEEALAQWHARLGLVDE